MKVKITRNENIPSGFKCAGCGRLHKDSSGRDRYYCELSKLYLPQDRNGNCYKTDECLLAVKYELLRR